MAYVDVDGTVTVENAERYFLNLIDKTSTADVVELSEVKKVIIDHILEQTVSKFPTAELCRASRMGAEGVIYALENAFGAKMDGVRKEDV